MFLPLGNYIYVVALTLPWFILKNVLELSLFTAFDQIVEALTLYDSTFIVVTTTYL